MKHVLKTMLVAAALGAASFLTAAPVSAHDYYRSGARVYVEVGPRDYRHRYYHHRRYSHRSYYRERCGWYRRRHDCGHHYGWRNRWRHHDRW